MLFFKKKKIEEPVQIKQPPTCNHKYKDFDMYITWEIRTDNNYWTLRVIEPYVCIKCKHRKDVTLYTAHGFSEKKLKDKVDEIKSSTKRIKEKFIIEDEINDMILVDQLYLEAYEKLQGIKSANLDVPSYNLLKPGDL